MLNSRFHAWLWIAGASILGCGLVAGIALGLRLGRRGPASVELPAPLLPEYANYWLLRSEDLLGELELSPEQGNLCDEVLGRYSLAERRLRRELDQLASDATAQLGEILSPAQQVRLREAQERYSIPHIEAEVVRELALMRREISLRAEQEPDVFRVTYDSFLAQRESFKEITARGAQGEDCERPLRHERRRLIDARLEELAPYLDAAQLAKYREIVAGRLRRCESRDAGTQEPAPAPGPQACGRAERRSAQRAI